MAIDILVFTNLASHMEKVSISGLTEVLLKAIS